jgi:hypothetical protein
MIGLFPFYLSTFEHREPFGGPPACFQFVRHLEVSLSTAGEGP